jgi:hypothetical protein
MAHQPIAPHGGAVVGGLSFPQEAILQLLALPHTYTPDATIATLVYVGETIVCWAAGDARRPLHTFDPLFFAKLFGVNAEGPYTFGNVQKWVSKKTVGYDIFRCKEWAIPINLEDRKHWVLVRVSLPLRASGDFEVRYIDSLPQKDDGHRAGKIRVRRLHKVLESFTVKSYYQYACCPRITRQPDAFRTVP